MKFEASICVCILNIRSSIGERRWRTRWKKGLKAGHTQDDTWWLIGEWVGWMRV